MACAVITLDTGEAEKSVAVPTVTVGPIVVNAGGTGILHGNVNSYTLNQYIVPDKCTADWTTENGVAARLSTDTKKIFFPKHDKTLASDKEVLRKLQRKWCVLVLSLMALSTLILLSALFFSLNNFITIDSGAGLTIDETAGEVGMEGAGLPGAPNLRSRSFWVAQPPLAPLDPNPLPARRIIVCHTATESCDSTSKCILKVRYIQQFQIDSLNVNDISYNYLVGDDGYVYVGRGWDKMGAHTKGSNNGTVGIAFIGTYIDVLPSPQQIESFNKLVALGVLLGKVTPDYSLVAQCQLKSTAAPGAALVRDMMTWPHYDSSLPVTTCTGLTGGNIEPPVLTKEDLIYNITTNSDSNNNNML